MTKRLGGLTLLLLAAQLQAQVVLDGKFGTSGALAGPNFNITADLGRLVDNKNLFHSFSQFSLLNSGDVATFSGPASIQNVLARVTGNDACIINGKIQCTIAGANFFLLNPHGVIFGPNAQLDVSGAFAASTANYLKLADGARFVAALDADDSGLSSAPVSAFGFLGSNAGSILVQQSALSSPAISFIGGDITINGGTVQAGKINLVSVKSASQVGADVSAFSAADGDILLQNSARLDVSGDGAGQIVIRGGRLIVDNSGIRADTSGAANGGSVDIVTASEVTLVNNGFIAAQTTSTGHGGDVFVTTGLLTLSHGGVISTTTAGMGDGGDIHVVADQIDLDGDGLLTGILADTTHGGGKGGDVYVNAPSLVIENGARISAATGGTGDGGSVIVAADSIHIEAEGAEALTGIAVSSTSGAADGGDAGTIAIVPFSQTLTLQVEAGGAIAATTYGGGAGGKIFITADSIQLEGEYVYNFTGIEAMTFGAGQGGDINVQTRSLTLSEGAGISAATRGTGSGGNIDIMADTLRVDSSAEIRADTIGIGVGGNIHIAANTLTLDGTREDGSAGLADIFAGNASGTDGDAPAGNIVIETGTLNLINGGQVNVQTKGASNSGSLSVTAETLLIGGNSSANYPTGLHADAIDGQGGDITVTAGDVKIRHGGEITAFTSGAGNGGSVRITADSLLVSGKGSVVSSESRPFASGTGGSIIINAGRLTVRDGGQLVVKSAESTTDAGNMEITSSLLYLLNGQLTAAAGHNGGNITIDPDFVILNNGRITADAIFGAGGRLVIDSQYLFSSPGTAADFITADSQFGNPGEVVINATQTDLSGELVTLPNSLLDAESLLRPYCGIRLTGGISTFLMVGKGGAALAPFGPAPAFDLRPSPGE